jgi:hypothetical protein
MLSRPQTKQAGDLPRSRKQIWANSVTSAYGDPLWAEDVHAYITSLLSLHEDRSFQYQRSPRRPAVSSRPGKKVRYQLSIMVQTMKCIKKHVLIHHISITVRIRRISCPAKYICTKNISKCRSMTSVSNTLTCSLRVLFQTTRAKRPRMNEPTAAGAMRDAAALVVAVAVAEAVAVAVWLSARGKRC